MILETTEFNENTATQSSCLIIMPIYNRRHFLQQAFKSLNEQTYHQWNLVIVDDGSTDEPSEVLKALTKALDQRITYVKQANGGPGSARATGQEFQTNQQYVAFFDSDDYWLPEYLERAIDQLENIPELDWIFCPCRRVDHSSGKTLLESTFFNEETNAPLHFLSMPVKRLGDAFIFPHNHTLAMTQLKQPIHAGFQNSVIRAKISRNVAIPEYRIGEDRYFLLAAILKGYGIGYIQDVGVIYHVHDDNLSDTNRDNKDVNKLVAVQQELCRSYSDIRKLTTDKEILAEAAQQSAKIKFWLIAYNYYWRSGEIGKALSTMIGVVLAHPGEFRYVKTLLASLLRAPIAVLSSTEKARH